MQIAIPVVLVVILGAVVVVAIGRGAVRMNKDRNDAVHEAPQETLEFVVPEGQDPAMVMAALRHEGFETVSSPVRPQLVTVSCHQSRDRDREHVRAVIAAAPIDPSGDDWDGPPVRFLDETGDDPGPQG